MAGFHQNVGTYAHTVAVPFVIYTRFSILPQGCYHLCGHSNGYSVVYKIAQKILRVNMACGKWNCTSVRFLLLPFYADPRQKLTAPDIASLPFLGATL